MNIEAKHVGAVAVGVGAWWFFTKTCRGRMLWAQLAARVTGKPVAACCADCAGTSNTSSASGTVGASEPLLGIGSGVPITLGIGSGATVAGATLSPSLMTIDRPASFLSCGGGPCEPLPPPSEPAPTVPLREQDAAPQIATVDVGSGGSSAVTSTRYDGGGYTGLVLAGGK